MLDMNTNKMTQKHSESSHREREKEAWLTETLHGFNNPPLTWDISVGQHVNMVSVTHPSFCWHVCLSTPGPWQSRDWPSVAALAL